MRISRSPFKQAGGQKVQWSSLIDSSHGWLETNFSSLSVPAALSLSMFHYIHCCGSERLDSHCTSLLWGWSYSNHFGLCLTDQDNGGERVFPARLCSQQQGLLPPNTGNRYEEHVQRVFDIEFTEIKWRKNLLCRVELCLKGIEFAFTNVPLCLNAQNGICNTFHFCLWDIFQHRYCSLQCHMILQKS